MFYVTIFVCETDMFCFRLQSQVDVDSGIETMEVDEVEMRQEAKRRRVGLCVKFFFTCIKMQC